MTKLILSAVLTLSPALVFSQGSLPAAAGGAKRAAQAAGFAVELRHISEALKVQGDEDDLSVLAKNGQAAIAQLRSERFSAEAVSVLDKLDADYAGLPQKTWAKDYSIDLAEIIGATPGWAADEGGTTQEMTARLDDALVIPDSPPDAAGSWTLFPENVPLAKFKKRNPILVFLAKHRLKRPKTIAQTTTQDIVAGQHNVQVGVEVEGVVNWTTNGREFDRDYCFNIGELHLEITPEWMLLHPKFVRPKVGQRVRAAGWTYYDVFHKAEHEYDPNDPVLGDQRYTLWEIHPVQDLTVLP